MSTAMTTFFSMPSARSISLALSTFYHTNQAVAGVRESGLYWSLLYMLVVLVV
jgi:hypothetical protein